MCEIIIFYDKVQNTNQARQIGLCLANEKRLTDIDVGQERGWQTEDEHQNVGHGQVDDEIIGDVPHPGWPTDDGYH